MERVQRENWDKAEELARKREEMRETRRKRKRRLVTVCVLTLLASGSAAGMKYGRDYLERQQLSFARHNVKELADRPPDQLPVRRWKESLTSASLKAQVAGPYAGEWKQVADELTIIGHNVPVALSNSFAKAMSETYTVLAKGILDMWKQAQLEGIPVDGHEGLEKWMEAEVERATTSSSRISR